MKTNPDFPQSVRIAARLCSVSEGGLRRMISAGIVPSIRVGVLGGGVRVIPSEAIAALRLRNIKMSWRRRRRASHG